MKGIFWILTVLVIEVGSIVGFLIWKFL